MSLPLPWQFSSTDDADLPNLKDRLQENFDAVGLGFPISIGQMSQVPQVRVTNSAVIATVTTVPKLLTFDTEVYDTNAMHSTLANTSRLVAPIAGLYDIGGCIEFVSNATGDRQLFITTGGAAIAATQVRAATGVATQLNVATHYRLAVGEFVELNATQSSGGGLNVVTNANYTPVFWMHWVSP